MNRVPEEGMVLVPGGSLITRTPEEGRALAITLARHTVHNIQPDLDILLGGRPNYSTTPDSLTRAAQVVAIEFQTIAAANDYWRAGG
ncbi:hexameric tyrosine-coordinated heme protein [Streptomyces albireticuli]|uniref:hexameric tyrosine-coordinated heme protein n=1 Tax=Streptomyces albireticuli TaxID=1940 RepID=UPI00367F43FD